MKILSKKNNLYYDIILYIIIWTVIYLKWLEL